MLNKILKSFLFVFVLCFSIVLSSCQDSLSEVNGVNYDSETGVISWAKDTAVQTYNLSVNGVKKLISSTENSYKLTESEIGTDKGTVSIEIEGLDGSGEVVSESNKEIVLLPDMIIEIKDGYFDWSNSVNELQAFIKAGNTVKYKAVLNGKELSELLTESKYKITAGNNEFRVKAVFTNSSLFYSNYQTASTKILNKPTNINYDAGMITWGDVDFYSSVVTYQVVCNSITKQTHSSHIDISEFYNSLDGVNHFEATVQAISSEEGIISSEVSDVFSYQYLGNIQNIQIKNGVITWDQLANATKYQLEIDGNTLPEFITSTSYVLGGNVSKTIRVRGYSDASVTVAKWSSLITVNTLSAPVPYFNAQSAIWSTVHNASYYKVNLIRYDNNGVELEKILDEARWVSNMIDLNAQCVKEGIYKLFVCACPDDLNTTYFESSYSEPIEIVRLGMPTRFRITESSPQKPDGEIMITMSGTHDGAKYICTLNGVTYGASNENSFTFSKPLASYSASLGNGYSTITLKIRTLAASANAVNNKLYLDSNEEISLELRQLNAPDDLEFVRKNNSDYVVWDAVEGALGYGVLFDNASKSSDTNEFAIPNLAAGNYAVSVYAKGDIIKDYNTINWKDNAEGNDPVSDVPNYYKDVEAKENMVIYLTSIYSTQLNIKKLETPTNISINANDSILTWDYVFDARGYMVYLSYGNNQKELYIAPESENGLLKTNMASIDPQLISEQANQSGFVVEVYAIGNTREATAGTETFIIDSEASSLGNNTVFHVLEAPTLTFSAENLSWLQVTNAKGYTINNVKRVISGVPYVNYSYTSVSGTSYAWSSTNDIEAGKYKICLTAEGDFIHYFNSNYSNVLEFTKLKTPELLHLDFDDSAYYIEIEEGVTEYIVKITGVGTEVQNFRLSIADQTEKGNVVNVSGKNYLRYVPEFNRSDNPTITIQAIGDEAQFYMASNTYKLTQTTRELNAPVNPTINASFNTETKMLSIVADVVNPFGKGYAFYFNDTMADIKDSPETLYQVGEFAELEVKVGYQGNVFVYENNEYIFYYDSPSSQASSTIYFLANVTITKAPTNSKGVFTVKFNKVTKGQYRFKYVITEEETGTPVFTSELIDIGTADEFKVDVKSYLESETNYKISYYIYSVGNDTGTIISNPDPYIYESLL